MRRVGEKRQRVGGEAGERLDTGEAEHERKNERERPARAELVLVVRAGHDADGSEGLRIASARFDMMPPGHLNGQLVRGED